jgi:hypothetical protein
MEGSGGGLTSGTIPVFFEETEEIHGKPQSRQPVCGPGFTREKRERQA